MSLKKRLFENFNLYAVTNLERQTPETLGQIDRAYQGGIGILQLRSKTMTDREMIRLGLKIREISRHYKKGFVVNNRVDIALTVNADGVHLGQEDLPVARARELIQKYGSCMAIGKSTHSLEQAKGAEEEGADYIGVGPIFPTPTKPDYPPVGIGLIHQVKAKIRLPFVAIGGIDESNLRQVLDAGASCVAVVRAVFSSPDPYISAKKLLELYESYHAQKV